MQNIELNPIPNNAPTQEVTERSWMNTFLNCLGVSLLGLGFGFSITVSTFTDHFVMKNTNMTTVATTMSTNATSSTTMMTPETSMEPSKFTDAVMNQFEPTIYSVYITIIFITAMLSTLLLGLLKLKRYHVIVLSSLLYGTGFLLNVYTMEYHVVAILARAIIGLAIGASLSVMIAYINDNIEGKAKNFLAILGPVNISLGAFITTLLALIPVSSVHSYSIFFGIYGTFFILLGLLLLMGQDKGPKEEVNLGAQPQKESILSLFAKNKIALIANMLLHASRQLSLINGVFMFSNEMFKNAYEKGESMIEPVTGSVILGLINVISSLCCVFWGSMTKDKKAMYFISQMLTAVVLIFLGCNVIPIPATFIFIFAFALGLGPLCWAIGPELFTKDFLPIGVGIGNIVNYSLSFCVPFLFKLSDDPSVQRAFFFGGSAFLFISGLLTFGLLKIQKDFKALADKIKFN